MYWIIGLIVFLLLLPQIVATYQEQIFYRLNQERLAKTKSVNVRHEVENEDGSIDVQLLALDGLLLHAKVYPRENPKGIVQLIHGVLEHKGRYDDFCRYLNAQGYVVVISDTRGHGDSTNQKYPHVMMQTVDELIFDQVLVTRFIKERYPNLPLSLFGHSLGSMIARIYLQNYDDEIEHLILTGTVTPYPLAPVGVFLARIVVFYFGKSGHSALLNALNPGKNDTLDWISYNLDNLDRIAKDPLCQVRLTNSGMLTMFTINTRLKEIAKFQCKNPDLKILSATGVDDTLITGGEKGLAESLDTLKKIGYHNITNLVYPEMKHEVIQEKNRLQVYQDIVAFIENKLKTEVKS